MKLTISFTLLLLGCAACAQNKEDVKFRFNDCVKVTKGFYKDCYGRVKDAHINDEYTVYLTCDGDTNIIRVISADDLQSEKDDTCGDR